MVAAAGYGENTIERQAVRLLFILHFCSDRKQLPLFGDYCHEIESESKLLKIDFWLRYPDHLAAALLRGCEPEGDRSLVKYAEEIRTAVHSIFQNREPVLRWVPMRRYLWGAYEPLERAMVFLASRSLVDRRYVEGGRRIHYFLTRKGDAAVEAILANCPESIWYAERCRLIDRFFGHLNGFRIRQLQYLEGEYAATPHWEMIGRIEDEVRRRFQKVFGEELC